MEMDSSSSFFPWDRLPLNLQETILGLLPISTLLRCTAVSRSLRSVVRSPSFLSSYRNPHPNPHFLFSRPNSPTGPAYDPLFDRWISLPVPSDNATSVCISDGPLLLQLSCSPDLVLSQPFAPRSCSSNIQRIPNPASLSPTALISQESPKHFMTVALRSTDRTRWEVYDSRTCKWETKGEFGGSLPMRASVFGGLVYCLACGGNIGQRLFTYDPAGGSESDLGYLNVPSAVRALYFLVFDGRLFLVGGEEDSGGEKVFGIGIWEMDRAITEWRAYCRMPEDVFSKIAKGGLVHLQISDGKGMVCFASYERIAGVCVLMCDLPAKRWWWPRASEGMSQGEVYCVAHAVEPNIDVLRGQSDDFGGLNSDGEGFLVSNDSGGTHDQSPPEQHSLEVDRETSTAERGDSEGDQERRE